MHSFLSSRSYARIATLSLLAAGVSAGAISGIFDSANGIALDNKAIDYWGPVNDPVARLEKKLEDGSAKLEYSPRGGYLPGLLKLLGINTDSQILVFSKTSFQAARISPRAPRALYFNDEVAVGSVQDGEVLELVSLDPKQGEIFYTLDVHKSDKPEFARRDVCLQCHQSPGTLYVPGILIGSAHIDASGIPILREGYSATDDRTPIDQRWGGWYVSGLTGSESHMGNTVEHDAAFRETYWANSTQNLKSISKLVDTSPLLEPTSDIVALMTIEHQTHMTNLMTRIGWDTRMASHDGSMDQAAQKRIDAEIEEMVVYMLFADEAKLHEPVQGISGFTKTFPGRGPRDRKGRSLRDFDLQTRMFKYPLSYMIYSETFDAMPAYVRERVWSRLYDVLTGKDENPIFARLSPTDRQNILEIVRGTKSGLPDYWNSTRPL
jgi:hypothetical protein